jgi:hypothetical protein
MFPLHTIEGPKALALRSFSQHLRPTPFVSSHTVTNVHTTLSDPTAADIAAVFAKFRKKRLLDQGLADRFGFTVFHSYYLVGPDCLYVPSSLSFPFILHLAAFLWCRRRGLNPHRAKLHRILRYTESKPCALPISPFSFIHYSLRSFRRVDFFLSFD